MKNFRRLSVLPVSFPLFLFCLFAALAVNGQYKYHSQDLVVSVKGGSSAGDWEIKTNKGEMEGIFAFAGNSKITGLYTMWFTVECESLKSGEPGLDKNAYKALKAASNETINFVLKSAKVKEIDASTYEIKCTGFLTIGGVEKETELIVNCVVNPDKSFTCTGSKTLKMSDFDIKLPPGIKPSDDIAISYHLKAGKVQ